MIPTTPYFFNLGLFLWPIVLFFLWSNFWKWLAVWHAARRGQTGWFVVFIFIHTLGILEIIYLFAIIKLKLSELFSKKV